MYGTIGWLRIKSGAEVDLIAQLGEFSEARVPGARALYLYRLDNDPHSFCTVLMFENKDSYLAYGAAGRSILDRLDGQLLLQAIEWNDGEIMYEREIAYGGL